MDTTESAPAVFNVELHRVLVTHPGPEPQPDDNTMDDAAPATPAAPHEFTQELKLAVSMKEQKLEVEILGRARLVIRLADVAACSVRLEGAHLVLVLCCVSPIGLRLIHTNGNFRKAELVSEEGIINRGLPGGLAVAHATTWTLFFNVVDWAHVEPHLFRCSLVLQMARKEQTEGFPTHVADPALEQRRKRLQNEHGRCKFVPQLLSRDPVVQARRKNVTSLIYLRLETHLKSNESFHETLCPSCGRRVRRYFRPPDGLERGVVYYAPDELRWGEEDETKLIAGSLEHPECCPALGLCLVDFLNQDGTFDSDDAVGVSTANSLVRPQAAPQAFGTFAFSPLADRALTQAIINANSQSTAGTRPPWSVVLTHFDRLLPNTRLEHAVLSARFSTLRRLEKSRNQQQIAAIFAHTEGPIRADFDRAVVLRSNLAPAPTDARNPIIPSVTTPLGGGARGRGGRGRGRGRGA